MREIERKVDMESTGSGQPDEAQQQLMIERQLAFDFYDPLSCAPCKGTVFQRLQIPPGNFRSSR